MVQNTLKVEEDVGGINDKKYFKVKKTKIKNLDNREDNSFEVSIILKKLSYS